MREKNTRITTNSNSRIAANLKRIATNIFVAFCIILFVAIRGASSAHAATISFSPASGSHKIGDTFSVNILVSSANQAMNAVSGIVSFPADKLQATSLSKSGSIISLWVQEPSFSNSVGTVNFEGIILNPGFTGANGKIITINFKAKAGGSASLVFTSGSVLANDGKGTNILESLESAAFTIEESASPAAPPETGVSGRQTKVPPAPIISSTTHPDSDRWYSNSSPEFKWKLAPDITGVSVYVSDKPLSNPGQVSDGLFNGKIYQNTEDGIWYLHLKIKNSFGWSPVSHFKFQIDTTPPKQFSISISTGKETDNPSPAIAFGTTDYLSGIDYYKLKIGDGDFATIIPEEATKNISYILPPQDPGKKTILVQALDKAGNYTIATEEFNINPLPAPVFTDYPKQIRTDETLALKGLAVADADVVIWLQREKDDARSYAVKSDEKGGFTFTADEKLKDGIYRIWAQATDNRGAKSDFSEKIFITVIPPTYLRIGKLLIDYLTISIILLILLLIIIFIILWAWKKIKERSKKVKRKATDAEKGLIRAFRHLEKEVEKQVMKFDRNPKRMSRKEKVIYNSLGKALRVSEKFIGKEIKDIESELRK